MITEQNTALSLGVDVKLVVHQEDEQDRQVDCGYLWSGVSWFLELPKYGSWDGLEMFRIEIPTKIWMICGEPYFRTPPCGKHVRDFYGLY